LPAAYQRGSSIIPSSPLFTVLALFLVFVLLVFAGIFYAEGNRNICGALIFAVAAIIFGLWYLKKRKGV
jgi:hypothetical protein